MYDACIKGVEATSIQTGLREDLTEIEERVEGEANKRIVIPITGITGEEVWALTAISLKAAQTGSLAYEFKTPPIADRIEISVGKENLLLFKWDF